MKIALTQGQVALVDDEDYEWLNQWKWFAAKFRSGKYYARRSIRNGKPSYLFMHRIIVNPTIGQEVDHINGDTLDNRRRNLRPCTRSQNMCNRSSNRGKSMGLKGVYPAYGKFVSKINHNGKEIYLGFFSDPLDAAREYDKAALEYHGQFAKLNISEDPYA